MTIMNNGISELKSTPLKLHSIIVKYIDLVVNNMTKSGRNHKSSLTNNSDFKVSFQYSWILISTIYQSKKYF